MKADIKNKKIKVLSFGGGVQTVAIAAMICNREIDMPDFAVFADTQWETKATYDYIKWFIPWCKDHGLQIYTTTKGNLRSDALDNEKKFASMPLWTMANDGRPGMLRRQCTREYKVEPVAKLIRKRLGYEPRKRIKEYVELWLGISTDEAHRMRDNRIKWIHNAYPLINLRMNRNDCIRYIERSRLPVPPKSSCIGCPFHSDTYWRNLKKNSKKEWNDVVQFDRDIKKHRVSIKRPASLHRSLKPLDEVPLDAAPDLFGNECDGVCGV